MVAQFVKNFVHLEGCQNRFDQYGGANASSRYAYVVLRKVEDVVPQPRLQIVLHFRKIKVRACAQLQPACGIVEEEQSKIEERAGNRPAAHQYMLLLQMPAAWPHQQGGGFFVQLIPLPFRAGELDRAIDGIPQIDVAVEI